MATIKSYGVAVSVASNDIGDLTDVVFSGGDVNFVDMTTHDSTGGWKEFLGGLKDGGSLDLTCAFDTADTGQDYLRSNPGGSGAVVVTLSDGATASFTGIIGMAQVSNPLDDKVEMTCSIKVSGAITYADPV